MNCSSSDGFLAYTECILLYFLGKAEEQVNVWESEALNWVAHEAALVFGTALLITPLLTPSFRACGWYFSLMLWAAFPQFNARMLDFAYPIAAAGIILVLIGVYSEYKA
jgi:hypothetical protein